MWNRKSTKPAEPKMRGPLRIRPVAMAAMVSVVTLVTIPIDPLPILGIDKILASFLQPPIEFDWRYQLFSQLVKLLIGFSFALVLFSSSRNYDEFDLGDQATKSKNSSRDLVVRRLEKRITELRSRSTMIYWTILSTLFSGIFVIIFASNLASRDSTMATLLASANSERQEAVNELQFYQSKALSSQLDMANAGVAQARFDIVEKNYQKILDAALASAINRNQDDKDIYSSGTVLRICVVALLIFLTQILVSLYRYNSRLIAFYCSRRDALTLVGGDPQKMKPLVALLFPTLLDFGREPRHPFQEFGGLLKSAVARTGKRKPASEGEQ